MGIIKAKVMFLEYNLSYFSPCSKGIIAKLTKTMLEEVTISNTDIVANSKEPFKYNKMKATCGLVLCTQLYLFPSSLHPFSRTNTAPSYLQLKQGNRAHSS